MADSDNTENNVIEAEVVPIQETNEEKTDVLLPEGTETGLEVAESLYDEEYDNLLRMYHDEDYSGVISKCVSLNNKEPDAKLVILQGNCYFKQGNLEKAVEKWEKSIEINPGIAEAYINLGNVEYSKNKINEAIKLWLFASTIKPESPSLNRNLGCAYGKKGIRYESIKYFTKYVRYEENKDTEAFKEVFTTMDLLRETAAKHCGLAEQSIKEGKYNNAVQHYMFAIENYPLQVKAPFCLGNIFYNDKNYEKAIYYWDIARKSPKIPRDLCLNLAKAYDRLKRYDTAYCFYSRYLPIVAQIPESYRIVKGRLIQLTTAFNKQEKVVSLHKILAENHENRCDFFKAAEEYENYSILSNDTSEELEKKISTYKMFYNPEVNIVNLIMNKMDEIKDTAKAEIIIDLCNRIMILAEEDSKEFAYAKAKKHSLIRLGK